MARSQADIAALYTELTTDPNTLGLTPPPTINDVGNADLLNEVLVAQQVDRKAIPVNELAQQVDRTEFNALSPGDQNWLMLVMQTGSLDINDTGQIKQGLLQCFGVGSETRQGMASRLTEAVNRVEQMYRQGLLEVGGYVTPSDISAARQYTP